MYAKGTLQELATSRVQEAAHLLEAGYFSGAYYLGGYAVEFGLKACIASQFRQDTIPDKKFVDSIYRHDLNGLMRLAGLELSQRQRVAADKTFAQNWEQVVRWSVDYRYMVVEEEQARSLIEALLDPDHGVFEWIKQHW